MLCQTARFPLESIDSSYKLPREIPIRGITATNIKMNNSGTIGEDVSNVVPLVVTSVANVVVTAVSVPTVVVVVLSICS